MRHVFHIPHEIRDTWRVEKVLITRRLVFKKVTIKPKVEYPKLKLQNVMSQSNVTDTCNNLLPRPSDSNRLILVKLKQNLSMEVMFILNQYIEVLSSFRLMQYLKILIAYSMGIRTIPRGKLPPLSSPS